MNGIINVLKPTGMTSHDVVSRIRRILSEKRVGHAGTLDPNAAGVLIICIGKATKLAEYLIDFDKKYICNMKLGILTDTFDIYGKEIATDKDLKYIDKKIILDVIESFLGKSEQLPPMYSAIKVKGKKLYEYAREEIEIERKKRDIVIKSIDLIEYNFPFLRFKIESTKGTYVRTICHDIGERLKSYGTMTSLIRVASKGLVIDDSVTLEEIEKMNKLNDHSFLLSYDKVLDLKSIIFNEKDISRLINGMSIQVKDCRVQEDMFYVRDERNDIIGLGEITERERVKIKKLLV